MAKTRSTSKRTERKEREAELRREDIVAAAAAVFSEKGFQGAQVAEIANAAEMSLNAVYMLFKGKEELYEAVILAAAKTVRDRVRAAVDPIPDPGEKLLRTIDALFACFEDQEHLLRIYARTAHGLPWRVRQALGADTAALFVSFRKWLIQIAMDAKRAGRLGELHPEAVAITLVGAVMTSAAQWVDSSGANRHPQQSIRIRAVFEALLTEARE